MAGTRHRSLIAVLALGCIVWAVRPQISGAADLTRIVASVDAATIVSSIPTSDRDLVSVRLDGGNVLVTSPLGAILPDGVDVDAISLLDDGRLVFSTNVSFEVDGVEADDEDLVLLDRGALSMVFDGSAAGLPSSVDIDAVHVVSLDPIKIYYSVDATVEIGATMITDDDIVRYAGTDHTVSSMT